MLRGDANLPTVGQCEVAPNGGRVQVEQHAVAKHDAHPAVGVRGAQTDIRHIAALHHMGAEQRQRALLEKNVGK